MFDVMVDDHVRLSLLRERHAPELLALIERDRDHLGRHLAWAAAFTTPDECAAFLARGVTCFAEDELPWMGIWHDGLLVGGVLWFPLQRPVRATDVGYWLDSRVGGGGIMTRSLQPLIDHVFDDLGVRRIGLAAAVDNAASRRMADRLGFAFEGVRRCAWMVGDVVEDHAQYALLSGDDRPWRSAEPTP